MVIKINEDIENYKETVVMGLTKEQFLFSGAALLVGAGLILVLFKTVGIMASCYIATPVIIPIALMGYYQMNGMNFFQFFSRFIKSLVAKTLKYSSTENEKEIMEITKTLEIAADSKPKKKEKREKVVGKK